MKINPGRHNFQIVFRSTCHFQTLFLSVTLGERIHFIASSRQKISVCPKRIQHFQEEGDNHIFTRMRDSLRKLLSGSSSLKLECLDACTLISETLGGVKSPPKYCPTYRRVSISNTFHRKTPVLCQY